MHASRLQSDRFRPAAVGSLPVLALALAVALAPSPAAHAQQVVAPNSLAAAEGNLENRLPFLVNGGMRYQQVYNASQFATVGAGNPITQIAFRPDATDGAAFSRNLSNVTIRLSTTTAAADGLSDTFASNVGADVVTVFTGSLTLASAFTGPRAGPKDFDIVINLTTPFVYNPAAGNLLLDVLNSSPEDNSIGVFFDAETGTGDSVSRIFSNEGQPNSATGSGIGSPSSLGLATRFTFTPVASAAAPEPGSLALLALMGLPVIATGCRGVGAFVRRNRVSRRQPKENVLR